MRIKFDNITPDTQLGLGTCEFMCQQAWGALKYQSGQIGLVWGQMVVYGPSKSEPGIQGIGPDS